MKLRQASPLFQQVHRRISALYVTGDRAKENFSVLTPYMEFSKTLIDEQEAMRENIARRRMNLHLNTVIKKYELFRFGELQKIELERKRDKIAEDLKALQNWKKTVSQSELDAKKHIGIELRNELKALKEQLYPVEDDFIHSFLHLPNTLHDQTPTDDPKLLYRQGIPNQVLESEKISHLDRIDLIDYRDPTCFYLMGDAAHFDFHMPINTVQHFLNHDYIQFINPDFVRTVLLEAAAIDLNQIDVIEEEDIKESKVNLLHLTGGGSMSSFLGFIAKMTIFPSCLPLRLVASGCEYRIPSDEEPKGLYTAVQSHRVQTFIAVKDESELDKEFEMTLCAAVDMFRDLGVDFRIVLQPAHQLSPAESARASIQMVSPTHNDYVEVGFLSNYSNYISKRLLFNFKEGKLHKFPYIAAGSIANVTAVIACLIENGVDLKKASHIRNKKQKDNLQNFKNLFS